jgi:hypothetical protein
MTSRARLHMSINCPMHLARTSGAGFNLRQANVFDFADYVK